MLKNFKYKNIFMEVNSSIVYCSGRLGIAKLPLSGSEVFCGLDFFFISSKVSFFGFIGFLKQLCVGLSSGYFVELRFVGLGYRIFNFGTYLLVKVGFGHYVRIVLPLGLHLVGFKNRVVVFSLDLVNLNLFARNFQSLRTPDIYKGKGIRVNNQEILFKIGKKR